MGRNTGVQTQAARPTRVGLGAALMGFALVCATVWLLFGLGGKSPPASAQELDLAPRLLRLTQAVQHAERSLSSQNYGACRDTLRKVQQDLSGLLSQVHAAEER